MQQAFFVRFVDRVISLNSRFSTVKLSKKVLSESSTLGQLNFYQKHGEKLEQYMQELNAGKEKAERLYARWNELEALKKMTDV